MSGVAYIACGATGFCSIPSYIMSLSVIFRSYFENDKWPSALGKYGIGKCNSNGEHLLALCTEFYLIVNNTMFKQKDAHKTTWTHPRSRHGHMIYFIITRCRDKMDICSTRTVRGANCGTDHQMLRSRVIFSIRRKYNQKGAMKP